MQVVQCRRRLARRAVAKICERTNVGTTTTETATETSASAMIGTEILKGNTETAIVNEIATVTDIRIANRSENGNAIAIVGTDVITLEIATTADPITTTMQMEAAGGTATDQAAADPTTALTTADTATVATRSICFANTIFRFLPAITLHLASFCTSQSHVYNDTILHQSSSSDAS